MLHPNTVGDPGARSLAEPISYEGTVWLGSAAFLLREGCGWKGAIWFRLSVVPNFRVPVGCSSLTSEEPRYTREVQRLRDGRCCQGREAIAKFEGWHEKCHQGHA